MKGKGFEELANFSPVEQGRVGRLVSQVSGKCGILIFPIMSYSFFSGSRTFLMGNNSEP